MATRRVGDLDAPADPTAVGLGREVQGHEFRQASCLLSIGKPLPAVVVLSVLADEVKEIVLHGDIPTAARLSRSTRARLTGRITGCLKCAEVHVPIEK